MKFEWIVVFLLVHVEGSIKKSPNEHREEDPGEPLNLTPLIQDGRLDEARNLSRVRQSSGPDLESYSGFLTVNPKFNSTMFFWYFFAQNDAATAPVVLWLQGGPGSSDQISLFFETGPFYVDDNLQLQPRSYAWNANFNMLYVDNPVGTGFSFTDSDDGYARNQTAVARDLYQVLIQILTLFGEHRKNEFYLAGESYAGKYIPSIAVKISDQNQRSSLKIDLRGLAIGNGFIDPITMNNYGDYLHNLGLIDSQTRIVYVELQDRLVDSIESGDYSEATSLFNFLINGKLKESLYRNVTGFENIYNFLYNVNNIDGTAMYAFLRQPSVRRAIHVGNRPNNPASKVNGFLHDDYMKSTKPQLESLLNGGLRVMLYSGQLDVIVPYVFTETMVNTLKWKNAEGFGSAPRVIWRVNPTDIHIAGYATQFGNFSLVLIRNAGHMAPHDQPRAAFDMISRFIAGKPFA